MLPDISKPYRQMYCDVICETLLTVTTVTCTALHNQEQLIAA